MKGWLCAAVPGVVLLGAVVVGACMPPPGPAGTSTSAGCDIPSTASMRRPTLQRHVLWPTPPLPVMGTGNQQRPGALPCASARQHIGARVLHAPGMWAYAWRPPSMWLPALCSGGRRAGWPPTVGTSTSSGAGIRPQAQSKMMSSAVITTPRPARRMRARSRATGAGRWAGEVAELEAWEPAERGELGGAAGIREMAIEMLKEK